jgi:hypothetical protein
MHCLVDHPVGFGGLALFYAFAVLAFVRFGVIDFLFGLTGVRALCSLLAATFTAASAKFPDCGRITGNPYITEW